MIQLQINYYSVKRHFNFTIINFQKKKEAHMKIGLVQFSPTWENPNESINTIKKMFGSNLDKFDLIIFPELTLTGFTMNSKKFSEELDGISTQFFMNLAIEQKSNVIAGLIELSKEGTFNSLIHIDPIGLIIARYRKIHPFSFAGEDKYYKASEEIVVTKINNVKIGLSICYDLRFPELYRLHIKQNAEVIVNIANWPVTRIDHWRTLLKARAIDNQCFMIGVNRIGEDPYNQYNGYSSIFDPMGNELVSVSNEEKIIYYEIDLNEVAKVRNKLPFLKDMKLI